MKTLKLRLLKYLASKLLNAVTIDELLRIEDGKIFIGKSQLSQEEIIKLKSEAHIFDKSHLWKLMRNN